LCGQEGKKEPKRVEGTHQHKTNKNGHHVRQPPQRHLLPSSVAFIGRAKVGIAAPVSHRRDHFTMYYS
jgi:hypothetical protein